MKEQYFFGRTLAKQIDFFAFPRTGSHFFRYCTVGLFDLVALPQPSTDDPEAIDRQRELDPLALYILDLREDGVPYVPVCFNARANGQHGIPVLGDCPAVVLMRDPMPTLYSFYRVARDRWGERIDRPAAWVRAKAKRYAEFYDAGLAIAAANPGRVLVLRYEDLAASPEALRRLVDFVGVRPKLRPELVHEVTRFERFARPGARTFYRAGDNDAWRSDADWAAILKEADLPDLTRFEHTGASAG